MAEPFVGEIRLFAGNFAPEGWMFCDGSLLPIEQYEVLFNLIGTTYGGNGETDFALPDLRGRLPLHQGAGFVIGQSAGEETVTLTTDQLPAHRHFFVGSGSATASIPTGNVLASTSGDALYTSAAPSVALATGAIAFAGGGGAHNNLMPYVCLNYIIALFGVFPSQS